MGVINIIFLGCLVLFPAPNAAEKAAEHEATAIEGGGTSLVERNERSLMEILAGEKEVQSVDSGTGPWQVRKKRNGNHKIPDDGHGPRKRRAVFTALTVGRAILDIGGDILTALDFANLIFGFFGSSEVTNDQLHEKLVQIESKIDALSKDIDELKLGQEYSDFVSRYSDDEQLLMNFADGLKHVDDSGIFTGYDPDRWAQVVLDPGPNGVAMALKNMHDMVMGTDCITCNGNSLFELLFRQMNGDWQRYFTEIPKRMALVFSVQTAGYAVCMAALKTKGDSHAVSLVHGDSVAKMNEQLELFEKYLQFDLGCPDGYTPYKDVCYKVIKESKTHSEASTFCAGQGPLGRLAMAKDSGTNDFLIRLKNDACKYCQFHFGLTDTAAEGQWKWPDGSDLGSFNYWAPGEPNDGGGWWCWGCKSQDCAVFKKDVAANGNQWDDRQCRQKLYFICEVSPSKVACEGETLQLRCSPQKRIHVTSASYGCDRSSPQGSEYNPCKHQNHPPTYEFVMLPIPGRPPHQYRPVHILIPPCHGYCRARSSVDIVRDNCENKDHCSVSASDSNFGDPHCRTGTIMYLTAEYECN